MLTNEKTREILVITEGEEKEPRLMEQLISIYELTGNFNITPYKTNIYILYYSMFDGQDPDIIDIRTHLREREKDESIKAALGKRFAETILIFDFEPQDARFSEEKIRRMMEFFNDSSDRGKLYINYPKAEAFEHMKSIPDAEYNTRTVPRDMLFRKQYKRLAKSESCIKYNEDLGTFEIDRCKCSIIIKQNIDKAWHITGHMGDALVPPDAVSILNEQLQKLKDEQVIAILCTCVFYIAEYDKKLLHNS